MILMAVLQAGTVAIWLCYPVVKKIEFVHNGRRCGLLLQIVSNLLVFFTLTKIFITNTVVGGAKLTMLVGFVSTFTIRVCAYVYAHYLSVYLSFKCLYSLSFKYLDCVVFGLGMGIWRNITHVLCSKAWHLTYRSMHLSQSGLRCSHIC